MKLFFSVVENADLEDVWSEDIYHQIFYSHHKMARQVKPVDLEGVPSHCIDMKALHTWEESDYFSSLKEKSENSQPIDASLNEAKEVSPLDSEFTSLSVQNQSSIEQRELSDNIDGIVHSKSI
eukprot:TRINITY_DN4633_c0_g1_i1.p1 TRINITY_DN4633_c0_g1~~TRINITY_DN4633_c0_g1_i1.p1  ORF type:complete len:123 (-),score=25.41 TRINITY_DN4633_c0_g1_i1:4-372(-)